jgi:hypothetical protein
MNNRKRIEQTKLESTGKKMNKITGLRKYLSITTLNIMVLTIHLKDTNPLIGLKNKIQLSLAYKKYTLLPKT